MADTLNNKISKIITKEKHKTEKEIDPIVHLYLKDNIYDTKVFWKRELIGGVQEFSMAYNGNACTSFVVKICGLLDIVSFKNFYDEIHCILQEAPYGSIKLVVNGGTPVYANFDVTGKTVGDVLIGTSGSRHPGVQYTPEIEM